MIGSSQCRPGCSTSYVIHLDNFVPKYQKLSKILLIPTRGYNKYKQYILVMCVQSQINLNPSKFTVYGCLWFSYSPLIMIIFLLAKFIRFSDYIKEIISKIFDLVTLLSFLTSSRRRSIHRCRIDTCFPPCILKVYSAYVYMIHNTPVLNTHSWLF